MVLKPRAIPKIVFCQAQARGIARVVRFILGTSQRKTMVQFGINALAALAIQVRIYVTLHCMIKRPMNSCSSLTLRLNESNDRLSKPVAQVWGPSR